LEKSQGAVLSAIRAGSLSIAPSAPAERIEHERFTAATVLAGNSSN